ncbi:hypothetical protein PQR02_36195, partial [Paraburkholderia sediminicola]
MLLRNGRFYYRQASGYSKDSGSFFIRKGVFRQPGLEIGTIGNDQNPFISGKKPAREDTRNSAL